MKRGTRYPPVSYSQYKATVSLRWRNASDRGRTGPRRSRELSSLDEHTVRQAIGGDGASSPWNYFPRNQLAGQQPVPDIPLHTSKPIGLLSCLMRIATWNVNSLKARLEKVSKWLDRARPDVLLMQETKLADSAAPVTEFRAAGYELAHHGEGQWNGVAIASRVGITDVVTNFGEPLRPARTPDVGDDEPLAEARMMAATCGEVRVVSLYAPNGRSVGSTFYDAKLVWYDRLARWLEQAADPSEPLVLGGDFNLAPEDQDVWDPEACHGGTHVSPREGDAFFWVCRVGLVDAYRLRHAKTGRYTWWDYRAGNFHKNFGMRIDHCLVSAPVRARVIAAEIDREARKGKPIPSDHAPVVIDLDEPGRAFDAGWAGAEGRI